MGNHGVRTIHLPQYFKVEYHLLNTYIYKGRLHLILKKLITIKIIQELIQNRFINLKKKNISTVNTHADAVFFVSNSTFFNS